MCSNVKMPRSVRRIYIVRTHGSESAPVMQVPRVYLILYILHYIFVDFVYFGVGAILDSRGRVNNYIKLEYYTKLKNRDFDTKFRVHM